MFSATRRSLTLTSNPLPYRVSVRANVVNLNRKYHKKVSALPFAISGDEAITLVGPWASAGVRGKHLLRTLLARHFPLLGFSPLQPDDLQAVYMPVWFIDAEFTGTLNKSGRKESVVVQSSNSYMPGFSSDPLSSLSFNQPRLDGLAVPFTPELRHQYGLEISCIPYSISPVSLPKIVSSMSPSQLKLSDSTSFDRRSIEFSMFAAYPVLLPVYLMRYDWTIDVVPQKLALTCIVQAHSTNPLVYVDAGTKAAGGLLRKHLPMQKGSTVHKFSHAADDMEIWDVVFGTAYPFSNIGVPFTHPVLDSTNKAVSEFVDERVKSRADMAALGRYGVNMNHPCVRMYTKDEVLANRKFLAASAMCFSTRRFLDDVPFEELATTMRDYKTSKGHPLKSEVDPDKLLREMMFGHMRGQMDTETKLREDLKPQWLRDLKSPRGPTSP